MNLTRNYIHLFSGIEEFSHSLTLKETVWVILKIGKKTIQDEFRIERNLEELFYFYPTFSMSETTINTNQTELLEQQKELIHACVTGDRNAQNRLYFDFSGKMFGVCMRYSRTREEAEEIMQEGFLQVFKSLHNFKYAGSFEGWIRKIMVYCAIQQYRSSPKLYAVADFEIITGKYVNRDDIIGGLQKKDLIKMIQKLPPAYRMVFNLHVFEGLKHREIADQLGISEGTSKSNFFDAKQILQKAIANSLKVAKNY